METTVSMNYSVLKTDEESKTFDVVVDGCVGPFPSREAAREYVKRQKISDLVDEELKNYPEN